MSGESAQSRAAGRQATLQANLSTNLSGVALPALKSMIGPNGELTQLLNSTENGQVLSSLDQKAYETSLGTLRNSFSQANRGSSEAIRYGALRAGEGRLSPGATDSVLASVATTLGRDQFMAEQNLKFASNAAGMTNYNKILNLFGQGTQTSLALGSGNAQAAANALGGMSTQTQAGSVMGGAAAGASLGSAVMPGWGTAIGAVVGGGIGYFSGG